MDQQAETQIFVEDGGVPIEQQTASKHKTAIFFLLVFKGLALFIYLFANWIIGNFILVFVVVVLLLACDFWTVKNVAGRLLVGLRWWNEVKEDGSNRWKYESKPQGRKIHPQDSFIFWAALYLTPLAWFILGLVCIVSFKLQYLLIVCVAVGLSSANVIGYWKCQKDAKAKIGSYITSKILSAAIAPSK